MTKLKLTKKGIDVLPRVKSKAAFFPHYSQQGMKHTLVPDLCVMGIECLSLDLKPGLGEVNRKGTCKDNCRALTLCTLIQINGFQQSKL